MTHGIYINIIANMTKIEKYLSETTDVDSDYLSSSSLSSFDELTPPVS